MEIEYFSVFDNNFYQDISDEVRPNKVYGQISDKDLYFKIMELFPETQGYGFTHRFEQFLKLIDDDNQDIASLSERLGGDLESYMEIYEKNKNIEEKQRLITEESLKEQEMDNGLTEEYSDNVIDGEETSELTYSQTIDENNTDNNTDNDEYNNEDNEDNEINSEDDNYNNSNNNSYNENDNPSEIENVDTPVQNTTSYDNNNEAKEDKIQSKNNVIKYDRIINHLKKSSFVKIRGRGVIGIVFRNIEYIARDTSEYKGSQFEDILRLESVTAVLHVIEGDLKGNLREETYKLPIKFKESDFIEFNSRLDMTLYLEYLSNEDNKIEQGFTEIDLIQVGGNKGHIIYSIGEKYVEQLEDVINKIKDSESSVGKVYDTQEHEKSKSDASSTSDTHKSMNESEIDLEKLKTLITKDIYIKGVRQFVRSKGEELLSRNIEVIAVKDFTLEAVFEPIDNKIQEDDTMEICKKLLLTYDIVLNDGRELKHKISFALKSNDNDKKVTYYYITDKHFTGVQEVVSEQGISMRNDSVDKFRYKEILIYLSDKEVNKFIKDLDIVKEDVPQVNDKTETDMNGNISGVGLESLNININKINQRVRNTVSGENIKKSLSMFKVFMYGLAKEGYLIRKHPSISGMYVVQSKGFLLGGGRELENTLNNINNNTEVPGKQKGAKTKSQSRYNNHYNQVLNNGWNGRNRHGGNNRYGGQLNNEILLISPYYAIAVESKTYKYEVVYNRLNNVLNLKELEVMLVNHGYAEMKNISYAMNLKNYGAFNVMFGGKNIINDIKRDGGSGLVKTGIKRMVLRNGDS